MAVREDKLGQSWLFPPCITDFIPKNHICNLIIEIIAKIDISEVEKKFKSQPGNPAYPRRMLLRILVQAAIDGIWSSRKIDKLAHENVIYMYLAGNEKPDFRTICNFRRENEELMEEVFKETVAVAKTLKILKLGHLSTDGTKIKANASNNYTLSEEELKRVRDIISKGIKIDEEEDSLYGDKRGDELPPELDTKEKIRDKIKEIEQSQGKKLKRAAKMLIEAHTTGDENQKKKIEEKINEAEVEIKKSGQKAVSITDPESRFMLNKKKRYELSYNPQITVDHDSGIIVANDVTQDCTDHHQLQPQLEMTEENVGKLPKETKVSADNGYFTGDNLRYLEEKKLDGYIPDGNLATKMKGNKRNDSLYSKDKFEYDGERDCFICPNGDVLVKKGEYEYNGKVQYHYYGAKCSECPSRADCAGVGKMRSIISDAYEAQRKRMLNKMGSAGGKEEYKKRKETVEWPFGNIKQNLGLREFFTRGLESVKTEHNLACIAHNLTVMWSKMGKNVGILC
jgi:transposase